MNFLCDIAMINPMADTFLIENIPGAQYFSKSVKIINFGNNFIIKDFFIDLNYLIYYH